MKYRHAHHAGNFADTVKHAVLVALLKAIARKDTPFFFLDTHAGRGWYLLHAAEMQQGAEYRSGILRLLDQLGTLPAELCEYLELVLRLGRGDIAKRELQGYAGSPLIAAALMRPTDRGLVFETERAEAGALRRELEAHPNFSVHAGDGYAALRSQLPPRERRGLVLIDPPFEAQEKEFDHVLAGLREALERWATGTYAIWYPIKRRGANTAFLEKLKKSGTRKILRTELCVHPDDSRVGLNGSGMLIINPPWQIAEELARTLPALHKALGADPGTRVECDWLVPE